MTLSNTSPPEIIAAAFRRLVELFAETPRVTPTELAMMTSLDYREAQRRWWVEVSRDCNGVEWCRAHGILAEAVEAEQQEGKNQ